MPGSRPNRRLPHPEIPKARPAARSGRAQHARQVAKSDRRYRGGSTHYKGGLSRPVRDYRSVFERSRLGWTLVERGIAPDLP
jgi:hypothetical protein